MSFDDDVPMMTWSKCGLCNAWQFPPVPAEIVAAGFDPLFNRCIQLVHQMHDHPDHALQWSGVSAEPTLASMDKLMAIVMDGMRALDIQLIGLAWHAAFDSSPPRPTSEWLPAYDSLRERMTPAGREFFDLLVETTGSEARLRMAAAEAAEGGGLSDE